MYHFNYNNAWCFTPHGLGIHISLGPTKSNSIFFPYIGEDMWQYIHKRKITSQNPYSPSFLNPGTFQLVNMSNGVGIKHGEDNSNRLFFTGLDTAHYSGTISILDEFTTGSILAQSSVFSKSDSILAYATLLEVGDRLVLLRLEDKRPPEYIVYTNNGRIYPMDSKEDIENEYGGLKIELMSGVEWYARLEAKKIQEEPLAYYTL